MPDLGIRQGKRFRGITVFQVTSQNPPPSPTHVSLEMGYFLIIELIDYKRRTGRAASGWGCASHPPPPPPPTPAPPDLST
jgi:hypothetical protein